MHTVACPFCYFRWNTVMHSAVTHHSQGKRLFQSCLRCSQSSLGGGGAPTWTTVCPGVRRGGTPAPKPLAEAGQWAVLAAKHALVLPALQRG